LTEKNRHDSAKRSEEDHSTSREGERGCGELIVTRKTKGFNSAADGARRGEKSEEERKERQERQERLEAFSQAQRNAPPLPSLL